jgi:hypothetical protein
MYANPRWNRQHSILVIMVTALSSGCSPKSSGTNGPTSQPSNANAAGDQGSNNNNNSGTLASQPSAGTSAIGTLGASAGDGSAISAAGAAAPVGTSAPLGTPMTTSNSGVSGASAAGSPATAAVGGMSAPSKDLSKGCGQSLPAVTDYGANGPFATTTTTGTGPDGMYTMVRPTTLGDNGFKHPPATWGNGITTTPSLYPGLLGAIASHGIVIIASDSSNVTAKLMTDGLNWLLAQNTTAGIFQGKLDTDCAISIGYSLGGGAATDTGSHPKVVTTVSFHGLPGNSAALHGPLLLFTSKKDDFVTADGFVTPNYNASTVQTFYATLVGAGDNGHLTPIFDAGPERAPAIAWLRLWVYGDQAAREYFYGDDCILCKDPWAMPQRKNWQ